MNPTTVHKTETTCAFEDAVRHEPLCIFEHRAPLFSVACNASLSENCVASRFSVYQFEVEQKLNGSKPTFGVVKVHQCRVTPVLVCRSPCRCERYKFTRNTYFNISFISIIKRTSVIREMTTPGPLADTHGPTSSCQLLLTAALSQEPSPAPTPPPASNLRLCLLVSHNLCNVLGVDGVRLQEVTLHDSHLHLDLLCVASPSGLGASASFPRQNC